jgi:hypothetical protein
LVTEVPVLPMAITTVTPALAALSTAVAKESVALV